MEGFVSAICSDRWVLRVDDHTFDFADADEVDSGRIHWCGVTADDLG